MRIAIILLLGSFLLSPLFARPARAAEPLPVAVLNFANQVQGPAGEAWDWLEKGLADLLIHALASREELLVVDREQMQQTLQGQGIDSPDPRQQRRLAELFAERYRVRRLVFGSYRVEGDQITLNAAVVDPQEGRLIQRLRVEGPSENVLHLQRELAGQVQAALLGQDDPEALAAAMPMWTESLPATKLLYQGIDHFDQGEFEQAWLLVRRAQRADPHYADALYWVGRLHYYMLQYDHARRYYEQFVY